MWVNIRTWRDCLVGRRTVNSPQQVANVFPLPILSSLLWNKRVQAAFMQKSSCRELRRGWHTGLSTKSSIMINAVRWILQGWGLFCFNRFDVWPKMQSKMKLFGCFIMPNHYFASFSEKAEDLSTYKHQLKTTTATFEIRSSNYQGHIALW